MSLFSLCDAGSASRKRQAVLPSVWLLLNPSEKEAVLEPGEVISHQNALFCPPLITASFTETL